MLLLTSTSDVIRVVTDAVANVLLEASIALSGVALGAVAPGDWVSLMFGRDADDGMDTCTVDAAVLAVSLDYTT